MRYVGRILCLFMALAILASCAGTPESDAGSRFAEAAASGRMKVGKPYQVKGVWYYPEADATYERTGIASWYGPDFHGKKTANGEFFDQAQISAAHTTLPLPSLVRVTNLDNGRELVVRVNDRGPFIDGRIIDLSRNAARQLGYEQKGVCRARVTLLAEETLAMLDTSGRGAPGRAGVMLASAAPVTPVTPVTRAQPVTRVEPVARVEAVAQVEPVQRSAPPPAHPPSTPLAPVQLASSELPGVGAFGKEWSVSPPARDRGKPLPAVGLGAAGTAGKVPPAGNDGVSPAGKRGIFVQAGAFAADTNAERLRRSLSNLGQAEVAPVRVGDGVFHRVRLGPYQSVEQAGAVVAHLVETGYSGARIVAN